MIRCNSGTNPVGFGAKHCGSILCVVWMDGEGERPWIRAEKPKHAKAGKASYMIYMEREARMGNSEQRGGGERAERVCGGGRSDRKKDRLIVRAL